MTTDIVDGTSWASYPRVRALGHPEIAGLLDDNVVVEEKIDGSQFQFGVFGGELKVRSKGKQMEVGAPENLFKPAVDTAVALMPVLREGWTYCGEAIARPKHNCLVYGRVPTGGVILFDVRSAPWTYLPYADKAAEAQRLGLEIVPSVYQGPGAGLSADLLRGMLQRTSCLGGPPIEGVVVKNYTKFHADGKPLFGKYVSEAFKEVQGKAWKDENPSKADVLGFLCERFRTPARWMKAAQHLRDAGALESSPRDIGPLIKEIQGDIVEECKQEIAEALLRLALPHIQRAATRGFPDWYKQQLLEKQFGP